jgi:hypothetical protein
MSGQKLARRRGGGRLLAHVAVVIGVLAVTAAAFALSYNAEPGTTQEKGPGTNGTPARFERVRSTPTPPGG